jgi:Uma2 family endonuclease
MVAVPKLEKPEKITPQEYLDWEEKQLIKYEYINGRVLVRTGLTLPHNEISINVATTLKNHLRGKGYKVLMADVKLGVSEPGPFHDPDVMVTCDERDRRATKIVYHPCLVVEVLSPGTQAFDRRKKFQNYRRIDTLKEYVLIDAREMWLERFRLNENGAWEFDNYEEGSEITLTSVDLTFPIEMLYEDVILEGVEEE